MATWLAPVRNGFTLISDEDRHLLRHRWGVVRPDGKKRYVTAWIDGRTVYLHRLIAKAQKGQEVDHINGDGLDNTRENLRIATRSQNCANKRGKPPKSGFKGVYEQPQGGRWQVKLKPNGKHISGGGYKCPKEAARVYDRLAREHFGEFAAVNFPEEENN